MISLKTFRIYYNKIQNKKKITRSILHYNNPPEIEIVQTRPVKSLSPNFDILTQNYKIDFNQKYSIKKHINNFANYEENKINKKASEIAVIIFSEYIFYILLFILLIDK